MRETINANPARNRNALFYLFLFIVISIHCFPGSVISGLEKNKTADAQTGVEFRPRLGEYHYEIRWGVKRVGRGVISIKRDNDHYVVTAAKETTGLVDKIYRLRYRGESRIKVENLSPSVALLEEESRKRKKVQEVLYPTAENGTVKVVETRTKIKQSEVETKEYEFVSDAGVVDIFSGIFLARSFDWQTGERHEFFIFIGSKQYLVALDCIGETTIEINGENVSAWVIRPTVNKTVQDNSSSTHTETLLYLSADESQDLMKIKTRLGIGSVKLKLVKFPDK